MISEFVSSWVCWAIALVALVCYQQLWAEYFEDRDNRSPSAGETGRQKFSGVLVGVLPLLGLLGTIIGLLDCFAAIASDGTDSTRLSNGISDALLTTQLGLVCAIPGWLLHSHLSARARTSIANDVMR